MSVGPKNHQKKTAQNEPSSLSRSISSRLLRFCMEGCMTSCKKKINHSTALRTRIQANICKVTQRLLVQRITRKRQLNTSPLRCRVPSRVGLLRFVWRSSKKILTHSTALRTMVQADICEVTQRLLVQRITRTRQL